MLILNDLHIGATRQGGTTLNSQQELKQYLRDSLQHLLEQHPNEHVVINGDFFDGFNVENTEIVAAYDILAKHLETGKLTMIAGNHDHHANGNKMSSWHLLCHLLRRVGFVLLDHTDGLSYVRSGVWVIPHMLNQDLFDAEIEKALQEDVRSIDSYLLLHCNYQNGWAEHSDHSLNLSEKQTNDLLEAGWTLILGHEHIARSFHDGKVFITGCQFPSSVADCIGSGYKRALHLESGELRSLTTWGIENYAEADWRNPNVGRERFIRITGEATAAEAADVIKTVAKLRQLSDAFVITNAVKIEGQAAIDEMGTCSLEEVRGFDVLSAIYENLTEKEIETVKGLLQ